jgi:hypothetical protein
MSSSIVHSSIESITDLSSMHLDYSKLLTVYTPTTPLIWLTDLTLCSCNATQNEG